MERRRLAPRAPPPTRRIHGRGNPHRAPHCPRSCSRSVSPVGAEPRCGTMWRACVAVRYVTTKRAAKSRVDAGRVGRAVHRVNKKRPRLSRNRGWKVFFCCSDLTHAARRKGEASKHTFPEAGGGDGRRRLPRHKSCLSPRLPAQETSLNV